MSDVVKFVYNAAEERRMLGASGDIGKFLLAKGREVEAEGKRLLSGQMVNVRTGRLRGSGTTKLTSRGSKSEAVVTWSTEYARHVHEKRPYAVSALETIARRL